MTIHERILSLRRAAGLSQEALAEQVGVSRQAIGKWESGASLPGLDNLQQLARALHVSCDELLTGEPSALAAPDSITPAGLQELLRAQSQAQAHTARRQRLFLSCAGAALVCIAAALGILGAVYGARIQSLSEQIDGFGANMADIDSRIDARISAIRDGIEESLRQQTSIVSSFQYDYGQPDDARHVPLTVTAVPKQYRDGISATVSVLPPSGAPILAQCVQQAGGAFTAELRIPLEMDYQEFAVTVSFTADGETQTEELFREYAFVSAYQTTAFVTPISFRAVPEDAPGGGTQLTLGGEMELYIERSSREDAAWPASAQIDLLIDGQSVYRDTIDLSAVFAPEPSGSDGLADSQAAQAIGMSYPFTIPDGTYPVQSSAELVAAVTDSSGLCVNARYPVYPSA